MNTQEEYELETQGTAPNLSVTIKDSSYHKYRKSFLNEYAQAAINANTTISGFHTANTTTTEFSVSSHSDSGKTGAYSYSTYCNNGKFVGTFYYDLNDKIGTDYGDASTHDISTVKFTVSKYSVEEEDSGWVNFNYTDHVSSPSGWVSPSTEQTPFVLNSSHTFNAILPSGKLTTKGDSQTVNYCRSIKVRCDNESSNSEQYTYVYFDINFIAVDTTELYDLYKEEDQVKKRSSAAYTDASFQTYTTRMSEALAALSGGKPQTDIDSAKTNLQSAINGLELKTPTITTQPADKTATEGYTTAPTMSVAVTQVSGLTYTYKWYEESTTGGTAVSVGTGATLTLPKGKTAGTYYYYCVVTASDGTHTKTATSRTASFTVTCTLTVGKVTNDAGINTATGSVASATSGTSVSATATLNNGYKFAGWFTAQNGTGMAVSTSNPYSFNISGNTTLYAKSELESYTITLNTDGGAVTGWTQVTANSKYTKTYNVTSTAITLPTPTKTGYTFAGWTGTDLSSATTTVTVAKGSTGNRSYTATWTANTNTAYTVEHYVMGTNGAYPATATKTENKTGTTAASLTLANLKDTTLEVANGIAYSYGQVGGTTVTTTTIAADGTRVIKLYYVRSQYVLTLNKETGISSVSGAGTYYYGQSVSIAATVATGYTWSKWSDNNTTKARSYTMPAAATTLTASATVKTYTITYKDQGNTAFSGTHESGAPTTHTYNTATTLVGASKTGYTFGGWFLTSDCLGSAVTSLGATAYTDDIILYAKWESAIPQYAVNIAISNGKFRIKFDNAGGEAAIEAYGTEYHPLGTKVEITAESTTDNKFLYWRDKKTNKVVSTEKYYSVELGENLYLEGVYASGSTGLITYYDPIGGDVIKVEKYSEGMSNPSTEIAPKYKGMVCTGWSATPKNENMTINAVYTSERKNSYNIRFDSETAGKATMSIASTDKDGKAYFDSKVIVNTEQANFSHWVLIYNETRIVGGIAEVVTTEETVSYSRKYVFYAYCDVTVRAVFNSTEDAEPMLHFIAYTESRGTDMDTPRNASFTITRTVPSNYQYITSGIIVTNSKGTKTDSEFYKYMMLENVDTSGGNLVQKKSSYKSVDGQYMLNITAKPGKIYYGRGYLTVYNISTEEYKVIYTDIIKLIVGSNVDTDGEIITNPDK